MINPCGVHAAVCDTLQLVMSASVKPRLAGRQPSNRGGVPRVMTGLSSHNRLSGKRGSGMTGP